MLRKIQIKVLIKIMIYLFQVQIIIIQVGHIFLVIIKKINLIFQLLILLYLIMKKAIFKNLEKIKNILEEERIVLVHKFQKTQPV